MFEWVMSLRELRDEMEVYWKRIIRNERLTEEEFQAYRKLQKDCHKCWVDERKAINKKKREDNEKSRLEDVKKTKFYFHFNRRQNYYVVFPLGKFPSTKDVDETTVNKYTLGRLKCLDRKPREGDFVNFIKGMGVFNCPVRFQKGDNILRTVKRFLPYYPQVTVYSNNPRYKHTKFDCPFVVVEENDPDYVLY